MTYVEPPGVMGDDSHAGEPRLCQRPVCIRLLEDADQVEPLSHGS